MRIVLRLKAETLEYFQLTHQIGWIRKVCNFEVIHCNSWLALLKPLGIQMVLQTLRNYIAFIL